MRWFPPIIAAAGAAFIFYQWAGARPFWVDEEMIALNIRDRSLNMLAGQLWLGQTAPLGWLALQRAILVVAGTSELALRFLPALFGAGTLAASVWVGRRWMTAAGASVFTALCTFGLWLSFYPLEMKHYSADAFWGLLLPALAVWAGESGGVQTVRRRAVAWWTIAALAHWLSNGGLFAAPGCALVLFALIWKRFGMREAAIFALTGVLWLASFGLYWHLCLRHAHHSTYLRQYWHGDFPPLALGLAGSLHWIALRVPRLAADPGGTSLWLVLAIAAGAGFMTAPRKALGLALATAPLTVFLLAAARLVPLYGRFALWAVPALYAGIALLADRAVVSARQPRAGRLLGMAVAIVAAAVVIPLATNIIWIGADDFRRTRVPFTNRGLDDRAASRWLLAQRRPGDAVLSTRLGWPALWWYGGMPATGAGRIGQEISDYEVGHRPPAADCGPELAAAMTPHKRALVHIGFPDLPEGFGELLLRHLDRIGAIASYREFSHIGFAAVIDLHTPGAEQSSLDLVPRRQPEPKRLAGCIAIQPAARW